MGIQPGETTVALRSGLAEGPSPPSLKVNPGAVAMSGERSGRSREGRLVLDDVHLVVRDGRALVRGISFCVEPREKLAIVGPNGAGKTSLMRLLFGRVPPTRGQVLLDGEPVHALPAMERARRIAVVSQSGQPDLRLTVRDLVDLGRIPHRGRVTARAHVAAVERAMELVGVAEMAGRRLVNLSGGERQRAAIARAIAQEPAILLLDEPTNHLDPRARADILDLAASLGATVIAILHDLDRVAAFADRVAVMAAGRLVAHAAPQQALDRTIVRSVFDMECFPVVHPTSGRTFIVFDTPSHRGTVEGEANGQA